MSEYNLRQLIIEKAQWLNASGLSVGKSGNISARFESGCLVTPTGVSYSKLQADDIVFIDAENNSHGRYEPSSEWHFHAGLYHSRPDVHAVVHTHSTYCTALACAHKQIPAFHYMVAIAGGKDIPLAPYAIFGSDELSKFVVEALVHRDACLLANHGLVVVGHNVSRACVLAEEVENLAHQYCETLQLGEAHVLSEQQMVAVLEKFKTYGQKE